MQNPNFGDKLSNEQIDFLKLLRKSCSHSILQMVTNSQSGHPGGSLSALDFMAVLYAFVLSQSNEPIVVSNGHISPVVYSLLAEFGVADKKEVVENFRKIGSLFEGHVTRHVRGVFFGTGPLGIGVSAASGMALAEKIRRKNEKVYAVIGDGEAQEGQVYEMMNFAAKYKLDNFVCFMDFNRVQLTASLTEIMPMDFRKIFEAASWQVIQVDGHDYQQIWEALSAGQNADKPVLILAETIMGKGVDFMEKTGLSHQADWHGKAPSLEQANEQLQKLVLSESEQKTLTEWIARNSKFNPPKPNFPELLSPIANFNRGENFTYEAGVAVDCRTAYGKALLDLAKRNDSIVALCADLRGSVMTQFLANEFPERHIEVGIAEQHMVSCAGGMSLSGLIPFCSTFGAFMTSRAKDQARVNDINQTNVKMVATHCGLSVGEDGPTHQAIDDMGSMLGLLNTMVIEPVDANQCDRIIRFIAGHFGNFYVRMGRHKFEPITKTDGSLFYDENYIYEYGKSDTIREGTDLTIVACGAMTSEALRAGDLLREKGISVEIIAINSIKVFDQNLEKSVKKTGKVVTLEDHNTFSGLGGQLARHLMKNSIKCEVFQQIGVEEYQLSGTWKDLYKAAKIDGVAVAQRIASLIA
jgi:transketolase